MSAAARWMQASGLEAQRLTPVPVVQPYDLTTPAATALRATAPTSSYCVAATPARAVAARPATASCAASATAIAATPVPSEGSRRAASPSVAARHFPHGLAYSATSGFGVVGGGSAGGLAGPGVPSGAGELVEELGGIPLGGIPLGRPPSRAARDSRRSGTPPPRSPTRGTSPGISTAPSPPMLAAAGAAAGAEGSAAAVPPPPARFSALSTAPRAQPSPDPLRFSSRLGAGFGGGSGDGLEASAAAILDAALASAHNSNGGRSSALAIKAGAIGEVPPALADAGIAAIYDDFQSMMQPHQQRVAMRRWQQFAEQGLADLELRKAARALGSRLVRARTLRRWSALRLAKQQTEIRELHQVAEWHLNTLLGAGAMPSGGSGRRDPVTATKRLVNRWAHSLLTKAITAWREWTKQERIDHISPELLERAGAFHKRMTFRHAWLVWDASYATHLAQLRVGTRWRSSHTAAAWVVWREWVVYRRAVEGLFHEARMLPGADLLKRWRRKRGEMSHRRRAAEHTWARTRARWLRVGMQSIKDAYIEHAGTGAIARAALSFQQKGPRMRSTFHLWKERTRHAIGFLAPMRAAVGRWHRQVLAFSFDRLAALASNSQVVRRTLGALGNRRLFGAFGAWVELWNMACEDGAKMRSAIGRMAHTGTAYAFFALKGNCERCRRNQRLKRTANEAAAPAKRMRRVLDLWTGRGRLRRGGLQVAQIFANGQISRAWRQWRGFASQRAAAQVTALRFLNRELFTSFETWRSTLAALAEALAALRVCVTAMMRRKLVRGWRAWLETAAEGREAQAMSRKVAGKFKNRAASAAWESWLECVRERLARRSAASSLVNVAAKWALLQWHGTVSEHLEKLVTMRGAIERIRKQGKSRGFERWREHTDEALEKATAVHACACKAAQLFRHAKLAASLRTWQSAAREASVAFGMLNTAAESLQPLRAPLTQWKETYLEQARFRSGALKAFGKWAGGLRGRWVEWMAFREAIKMEKMRMQTCGRIWRDKEATALTHAFETLSTYATDMAKLQRAVHLLKGSKLLKCFRIWRVDTKRVRAGNMLKNSAVHSRLGRGFVTLYKAYKASLVRYQQGRWLTAKAHVLKSKMFEALGAWKHLLVERAAAAEQREVAEAAHVLGALRCLSRRAANRLNGEVRATRADGLWRLMALRRPLARMVALGAPGGEWQLRTVAYAAAVQNTSRKAYATWQLHNYRVLCVRTAKHHLACVTLRKHLRALGVVAAEAARKRTAHRRMVQLRVERRLLAMIFGAWRRGARLKILSFPSHLLHVAQAWGAGPEHWRLIELREAERRSAHSMAHHAAAMEQARLDAQRLRLELVRHNVEDELHRLHPGGWAPGGRPMGAPLPPHTAAQAAATHAAAAYAGAAPPPAAESYPPVAAIGLGSGAFGAGSLYGGGGGLGSLYSSAYGRGLGSCALGGGGIASGAGGADGGRLAAALGRAFPDGTTLVAAQNSSLPPSLAAMHSQHARALASASAGGWAGGLAATLDGGQRAHLLSQPAATRSAPEGVSGGARGARGAGSAGSIHSQFTGAGSAGSATAAAAAEAAALMQLRAELTPSALTAARARPPQPSDAAAMYRTLAEYGFGGGGGGGAAAAAAAAGGGMYGRPPLGAMPSQAGHAAALSNASALSNAVATRAAAALQRAATSSGSAVGAPAANLLDQLGGLRAGSYLDGITAWASESIEDVRLAHPQGGAH